MFLSVTEKADWEEKISGSAKRMLTEPGSSGNPGPKINTDT